MSDCIKTPSEEKSQYEREASEENGLIEYFLACHLNATVRANI